MKQVKLFLTAFALFIAMGTQNVMSQDAKLLKAAEKGKIEAIKTLVSNYWNGTDGFEKNAEQAKFWANKIFEAGRADDLEAQYWMLGRCMKGDMVWNKNMKSAQSWATAILRNPKLKGNDRAAFMEIKEEIDQELAKEEKAKKEWEAEQERKRETEMRARAEADMLKNPHSLAQRIISIIDNKNTPFSEAEEYSEKLLAMEESEAKRAAIKSVIKECQLMGTGYNPDNDLYLSMSHEGTERGRLEMALAAKLQQQMIEGGDINELIDFAYRCRQSGDIANAKKYFQQGADKGNAMAMRGLAFCYEDENNNVEAEKWYTKLLETDASEQYCVDAMDFFRKTNQPQKILKILEISAEKTNNRDAMLRLGDIYRNGKDWDFKKSGIKVTKNLATAIKWYKKAREVGSKAALFFMADCYWTGGTGVKQNRAEASKLYQKLMDEVGIFNLNISEAEADEKSKANYRMGYCYENGIGAVRNIPKAWDLYCNSHEADAYYRRGVMMEKRWVYERLRPDIRRQQVRQFYQTAANMGHKQAQQALNRMYR